MPDDLTTPLTSAFLHEAPLAAGDVVRIVSPSGIAKQENLDIAVDALTSWGLEVQVGPHALARDARAETYLAGSDDERRADLVDAWCDPEVSAVVSLRGGFGAMRLLDGIDWDAMRAGMLRPDGRPKLLTGSSDITALHRAFAHHLGVPSLFSPMPGNDVFRDSAAIREDVRRWMLEPWAGRSVTGTAEVMGSEEVPSAAKTMVPGTARGVLTGGNLSLLAAAVGAPEDSAPSTLAGERKPAILAIEDVDEKSYRPDNLILQLHRSGWLAGGAGIAFGSWEGCGELEPLEALCREYCEPLGVPVVWELGFGHDPHAASIPMGAPVELSAPEAGSPSLTVLG